MKKKTEDSYITNETHSRLEAQLHKIKTRNSLNFLLWWAEDRPVFVRLFYYWGQDNMQ